MPQNPYASIAVQDEANPYTSIAVKPPAPEPSMIQKAQKAFDNLTTVTPEQEQGHGEVVNQMQKFGAGAIQGLGSPFVHPLQTIEEVGKLVSANLGNKQAADEIVNGVKANPAGFVGNLVGGAVLGGGLEELPGGGIPFKSPSQGPGTLGRIADVIPTRAKAGKLFDTAMATAKNEPVQLTNAMTPLERAQQLSARGHGTISSADNLYKRVNTVNPLDYQEARDWGSGLSNITGEGKMNATPTLQRQIGKVSKAFNQDIADAAERAGVGDVHNQAMQTYARAMQIRKALINAAKFGGGAVATGYLAHRLIPALLPER